MDNDWPTAAPLVTMKAPVLAEVVCVVAVTAKPETVTTPVEGFTTKDATVDNPSPVPDAELTAVIEN